jgi:sugar lactone lactonase YvrE
MLRGSWIKSCVIFAFQALLGLLRTLICLSTMAAMLGAGAGLALAAAGDGVADRLLGQPNCTTNAPNTVDPEAMNQPNAVAVDKSTNHVYVADTNNNRVLGYPDIQTLLSGGSATLVIGQPNLFTSGGGTSATTLNGPKALAVDKTGNLYVADSNNNRVLEFNKPFSSGFVASQPANLVFGQELDFTSNQCNGGQSGIASPETMCNPSGVAVDSNGNLFVADTNNNRVLAFTAPFNAATEADVVYGQFDYFFSTACNNGPSNTPPTSQTLCGPNSLAVDASNNLYVVDTNNNRVLKFNSPLTNTVADVVFGQNGSFTQNGCNQNTSPSSSSLCGPVGVTLDGLGDVFIADSNNNRVLEFASGRTTAEFVFGQSGSFSNTSCNAGFPVPSNATLCTPRGLATDSSNNLWITDNNNNRILRYPAPLKATTVANLELGQPDFAHMVANTVDATGLNSPAAVAIDKSSSPNHLWVVDTANNRVLGYTSAATFTTYSAANIVVGQVDFFSGNSNQGSSTSANSLSNPTAAVVDASGNLFVADTGNNRVLMFTAPFKSGITKNQAASVVFGQPNFTTNMGICPPSLSPCPPLPPAAGTATALGMCSPSGVAIDTRAGKGILYVSDEQNSRVLAFKPSFTGNPPAPSFVLGQSTFTGNYSNRQNGCGFIFPTNATLSAPEQIATDALGDLYVNDTGNNRTLEYNAASLTTSGVPANLVFGQLGNFTASDCNLDDREPTIGNVTLCGPEGAAADTSAAPNLYISDLQNNRVLWFGGPLTGGPSPGADIVIGQPDFVTSLCNLGGSAPSCATLCGPRTPAVDVSGNLYVPDTSNNRVLEYNNPDPPLATAKPTPTHTPTPKPTPAPAAHPASAAPVTLVTGN